MKVSKDGVNFREIESDFDAEGNDRSMAAATAKGYRAYIDVTKDGKTVHTIDASGDSMRSAFAKGYKLAEPSVANTYVADKSKQLDSPLGMLETAGRSAINTVTLGLGDEFQAAVRAPFSKKSYGQLRDDYRKDSHLADEVNPKIALASTVAASLPTVLGSVPAGLVKMATQSARIGAVQGFGESESDSIKGLGTDSLQGAGIGAAVPLAFAGAGKVVTKVIPKVATVGAKALTGLPEETIEHYASRNAQTRATRPLEDVAREVSTSVESLAGRVSRGSGESFEILAREGVELPKSTVVDALQEKVNSLRNSGVFSPTRAREVSVIQGFIENVEAQAGDVISGPRVKALLQQIDEELTPMKKKAGDIATTAQREFAGGRSEIDGVLKSKSPAYGDKMVDVAEDTRLTAELNPSFGTPTNAFNNLKAIARERSPFKKETLQNLDGAIGSDLTREAKDSMVHEAFKGQATNGSRNVNFFTNSVPYIGPVLGYAADTLGRPTVAKAIDIGVKLKPFAEKLGKFGKPLMDAAAKGPAQLLMTHELLSKNPEYVRALEAQK